MIFIFGISIRQPKFKINTRDKGLLSLFFKLIKGALVTKITIQFNK